MKVDDCNIRYDLDNDIMYLYFDANLDDSCGYEMEEGIFLRKDINTEEVTGIIICDPLRYTKDREMKLEKLGYEFSIPLALSRQGLTKCQQISPDKVRTFDSGDLRESFYARPDTFVITLPNLEKEEESPYEYDYSGDLLPGICIVQDSRERKIMGLIVSNAYKCFEERWETLQEAGFYNVSEILTHKRIDSPFSTE